MLGFNSTGMCFAICYDSDGLYIPGVFGDYLITLEVAK